MANVNYLELSDEELMNAPAPEITGFTGVNSFGGDDNDEGQAAPDEGQVITNNTDAGADAGEQNQDAGEGEGGDDDGEQGEQAGEDDSNAGTDAGEQDDAAGTDAGESGEKDQGDGEGEDDAASGERSDAGKAESADAGTGAKGTGKEGEGKDGEKAAEAAVTIDYKAEYEKLTKPFKANGREIAVENVEDAIQLMQMGANYSKKMTALKPNLKLMKLLETKGLLNEEKISYLIDLASGNTGAINKLVNDSKIDPMDLSAAKAGEYAPTTHKVEDHVIDLDNVLDDLKESPKYTQTLKLVGEQWDEASRQKIVKTPEVLRVINQHMETGVYDIIAAKVETERTFGRLKGLTDIDAYRQVGDALNAAGAFNHLGLGSSQSKAETAPKTVVAPPKPKVDDDKLKDKRRAASPTKAVTPKSAPAQDFNPLSMSDEEFAKQANPRFS